MQLTSDFQTFGIALEDDAIVYLFLISVEIKIFLHGICQNQHCLMIGSKDSLPATNVQQNTRRFQLATKKFELDFRTFPDSIIRNSGQEDYVHWHPKFLKRSYQEFQFHLIFPPEFPKFLFERSRARN